MKFFILWGCVTVGSSHFLSWEEWAATGVACTYSCLCNLTIFSMDTANLTSGYPLSRKTVGDLDEVYMLCADLYHSNHQECWKSHFHLSHENGEQRVPSSFFCQSFWLCLHRYWKKHKRSPFFRLDTSCLMLEKLNDNSGSLFKPFFLWVAVNLKSEWFVLI